MLILLLSAFFHMVFTQLDIAEKYSAFAQQREIYELDELVFTLLTLTGLSILFGFRRWRELSQTYKEQVRAQQELERVNTKLESVIFDNIALSKQISITQDEEKHHLIMELHDIFGQHLAAIDANISSVLTSMDDESVKQRLNSALNSTQHLSMLTSQKLRDLRPPNINLLSLTEALSQLINDWEVTHDKIQVEASLVSLQSQYTESVKVAIYRIVQEALNNIAKHSQAANIYISLNENQQNNLLSLKVKDDGVGILEDTNSLGIGLANMKYRCEAFKGDFGIKRTQDGFTCLTANIPI